MTRAYMPQAKTVEWQTPQAFFNALDREFHFGLDPCATTTNAKCRVFFTKHEDGLSRSWANCPVFVNPPYGRELIKWVQKAWRESRLSPYPIVMLLPARTDTRWWYAYVMRADEIRFVEGRLKFGGCKDSATFPSVVVVFRCSMDTRKDGPKCITMSAKQI